jgi:hypothetical protein
VTTVVERDDEGYPYGPIQYGLNPFSFGPRRSKGGAISDYMTWYESLNARPAKTDEEDGQDG